MKAPLLGALGALWMVAGLSAATYPEPPPVVDETALGVNVTRTMSLLAGSTAERPNTVKIVFYGQSITDHKPWVDRTIADLRARFPHANLVAENRAIGGFASQRLINTAEHDIYPFYPDLMVFHVYGAHDTYEDLIRLTRTRTTAEVLITNDHIGGTETLQGGEYVGDSWTTYMDGFTRDTAVKYRAQYVDVRDYWSRYLVENDYQPRTLLKDNVHMNDQGDYVLGELVMRELVHRPDLAADPTGLMEEVVVAPADLDETGALELYFSGNRVDLVLEPPASGVVDGGWDVTIDGEAPSTFPGAYSFTRPSPAPWSGRISLNRVDSQTARLLENWTLTVTSVSGSYFTFDASGTLTGPDGSGRSDQTFLSNSGRVWIDQEDGPGSTEVTKWFGRDNGQTVAVGQKYTWQTVGHFADRAVFPGGGATRAEVTAVQGIPNRRHRLRLTPAGSNPPALRAVRLYRPFWDRQQKFWGDTDALEIDGLAGSTATLGVVAEGSWALRDLPAWLTASLTSGQDSAAITLTAQRNDTGSTRTANLRLTKSGFANFPVTVSQVAGPPPPRESIFRAPGQTEPWLASALDWVWDAHYPWVFGWRLGWFHVANDDPASFFFYRLEGGWAWTGSAWLPAYYDFGGAEPGWRNLP